MEGGFTICAFWGKQLVGCMILLPGQRWVDMFAAMREGHWHYPLQLAGQLSGTSSWLLASFHWTSKTSLEKNQTLHLALFRKIVSSLHGEAKASLNTGWNPWKLDFDVLYLFKRLAACLSEEKGSLGREGRERSPWLWRKEARRSVLDLKLLLRFARLVFVWAMSTGLVFVVEKE